MTPLSFDDGDTPREAADRLYDVCDELERRQVPADQVEELRALSEPYGWPVCFLGAARGLCAEAKVVLVDARLRLLRGIIKRPEVAGGLADELTRTFYVLRNYAYFADFQRKELRDLCREMDQP